MAVRRLRVSPRRKRLVSRLLQVAIGAILVVGLLARNLSVVVNAVLALVLTFVPAMLERDYRLQLDAGVTLWLALALFLHMLGMLGFYDEFWWFDHVTHTLSAALVAAGGYVVTRAVDEWTDDLYLPSRFMFVFVLLFTLGLGVFWEVLEFAARIGAELLGFEPVLIQYGLEDSLLDLLFDTLGAVIAQQLAGLARLLAPVDVAAALHGAPGNAASVPTRSGNEVGELDGSLVGLGEALDWFSSPLVGPLDLVQSQNRVGRRRFVDDDAPESVVGPISEGVFGVLLCRPKWRDELTRVRSTVERRVERLLVPWGPGFREVDDVLLTERVVVPAHRQAKFGLAALGAGRFETKTACGAGETADERPCEELSARERTLVHRAPSAG